MIKFSKTSSIFVLTAASIALTFGFAGCNKGSAPDNSAQNQPADQTQTDQSQDPAAAANLAPSPAPASSSGPADSNPPSSARSDNDSSDSGYDDADEDTSYGQPVVYAPQPPPELPEYSQPDIPGDGYLWTPGYWSYASGGYYWVPGAWARPPEVGYLWTPGYWNYSGGRYRYNNGYWGRHIGYYGGVNYR